MEKIIDESVQGNSLSLKRTKRTHVTFTLKVMGVP